MWLTKKSTTLILTQIDLSCHFLNAIFFIVSDFVRKIVRILYEDPLVSDALKKLINANGT